MANSFICMGHRGAAGLGPENTILGIKKAIADGVDWIEIDVHRIEDELIALHGHRLEDETSGYGYLSDQPLSYVKQLRVNGGGDLATLDEVLACVEGRCGLNVDIKSADTAEIVVDTIHRHLRHSCWDYSKFMVSSFNQLEIVSVKRFDHHINTGAFIHALPFSYGAFAEEIQADVVFSNKYYTTLPFVEDCHARGIKVIPFTVNIEEEMKVLGRMGVDGFITDFPGRVHRWNAHKHSQAVLF